MDLTTGTRLGPYEIVSRIGAGGMGEVYRARDSRLERDVAIKVLPSHLSSSPQFRERFEREAKAISQLNHPNICTLHDVGHEGGTSFLVMELLEGESLADKISNGPMPTEQVLRYGVQIAEALDRAHRQGIVHRDMKPGNIMITKSGAKLLDFGLAKSHSSVRTSQSSVSATQNKPLTEEGTVLGTFQYMAPEQIEGEEADPRTDIFGLGTVLYEMATGKRAFEGKTKTSLIAAIVSSDPAPISRSQPLTPRAFDHVVSKCLSKERDDRWQSAHDVAEELRWIAEAGSEPGVASPIASRSRTRESWLLATTIAACIATAVLASLLWRSRAAAPRTIRSTILPPASMQFDYSRVQAASLSVSPDGRYLTFAASKEHGRPMLWLRALDSDTAQPLAGTEGAQCPFWSPDSRSIGFFGSSKLRRMDIGGGPAVALADAADGRGGTWSSDGFILFSPSWRTGVYRVPATGGVATPITKVDEKTGETTHRWPALLPDGRHFLYLSGSHRSAANSDQNVIYIGSIDSSERKVLLRARSNAMYVPGYVLFVRENWLLAQPFDAKALVTTGEPIRVAENVTYDSGFFRASFGASNEGTLAYFTGPATVSAQLAWYDRTGKELSKVGEPLGYLQTDIVQTIRLSPDETKVALEVGDTADIWIFDLARETRARFTTDPMNDQSPVWSPDGATIVYSNDRDVFLSLYRKPTDGLSRETLVVGKSGTLLSATSWSPDGKYLAIDAHDESAPDEKSDIWILPLTAANVRPSPIVDADFREDGGQFSPDGKWLTYMSNETGRTELYALSFPSRREKRQLTNNGLTRYAWRRDGREIIFMALDRTVMSVVVSGAEFSTPKPLFKPDVSMIIGDVTRDGRILAAVAQPREAVPITLVTNWK